MNHDAVIQATWSISHLRDDNVSQVLSAAQKFIESRAGHLPVGGVSFLLDAISKWPSDSLDDRLDVVAIFLQHFPETHFDGHALELLLDDIQKLNLEETFQTVAMAERLMHLTEIHSTIPAWFINWAVAMASSIPVAQRADVLKSVEAVIKWARPGSIGEEDLVELLNDDLHIADKRQRELTIAQAKQLLGVRSYEGRDIWNMIRALGRYQNEPGTREHLVYVLSLYLQEDADVTIDKIIELAFNLHDAPSQVNPSASSSCLKLETFLKDYLAKHA